MIRDFNIRDNNWNFSYTHHSIYADTLKEIAHSLNLELSTSVDQVPNQYVNNS